ncbi:1,4-alpha-D-glucan glucanohydrolase 1 [Saitozyma sp. JCM 24511]|nr:1,4-alpha-D-glucan glucanohydrolase 1 [Saitozyma sp. JCM 24511]
MLSKLVAALALAGAIQPALGLTAEQWKGKTIYQLITDRFAPASDTAPARTNPIPTVCNPIDQTWCGGTWLSVIDKLDYIQGMGIDAVWISPISKNIDVHTPYNYAYHGYWVNDPLTLNPRFGSDADLNALSAALHARGMYLMVDIVVNNIPSLSVNASTNATALTADGSRWTDPSYFHPFCWIDYNNQTSVEYCWLGDENLALMDVNTENQYVISTLQSWIQNFTTTYQIDGLRIDAAKHIPGSFWPGFCGAAGVFCIGEVYGSDIGFASQFQTQSWMDSILGYPLYYGIVDGFGAPNGNMSGFVTIANQVLTAFPKPYLLGNFIENHDLPRWRNTTVDPQLAYNAMVAQFVFDGIPIVYYGQEQDFSNGAADPYNRAALWPSNYTNTSTYQHIARLNKVRKAVIANNTLFNGQSFLNSTSKIIASTATDVAIRKGPLLAVLTNRGSPSQNASFGVTQSGWSSQSSVVDVLSCKPFTTGADGTISVSYAASGYGGMPYLFMSQADVQALGVCSSGGVPTTASNSTTNVKSGSTSVVEGVPILALLGSAAVALLGTLVL